MAPEGSEAKVELDVSFEVRVDSGFKVETLSSLKTGSGVLMIDDDDPVSMITGSLSVMLTFCSCSCLCFPSCCNI